MGTAYFLWPYDSALTVSPETNRANPIQSISLILITEGYFSQYGLGQPAIINYQYRLNRTFEISMAKHIKVYFSLLLHHSNRHYQGAGAMLHIDIQESRMVKVPSSKISLVTIAREDRSQKFADHPLNILFQEDIYYICLESTAHNLSYPLPSNKDAG